MAVCTILLQCKDTCLSRYRAHASNVMDAHVFPLRHTAMAALDETGASLMILQR